MANKNLAARSPFQRQGSASAKIYAVLAKSAKPLPSDEIAKRAKVSQKQASTLLAAYMNPYHNAPLRRAGVQITSEEGKFSLSTAKATPNAKRPPRGIESTKKAKKASKSKPTPSKKSSRKSTTKSKKPAAKTVMPAAAEMTVAPDVAAAVSAPQGDQSK